MTPNAWVATVFLNVLLQALKKSTSDYTPVSLICPQVQVVELKVTWITKSFCPGGTDSVSPPPSVITQENQGR